MTRNNLHRTLIASMYALDGRNGEFLGDLSRPISITREAFRRRANAEIPLALIPALTPDTKPLALMDYREILADLTSALDS